MVDDKNKQSKNITSAADLIVSNKGDFPLLLKVSEASRLLRVGRTTVYKLIREGGLSARKIGRSIRITSDSVLREAGCLK